jgi:predicted ABC-type ATPase
MERSNILMQPRVRMIAGPNGSGKSVVYQSIKGQYRCGAYVNADEIERKLSTDGFVHLSDYGIELSESNLQEALSRSAFVAKSHEANMKIELSIVDNVLVNTANSSHSYEAAFVAQWLRSELIRRQSTFTFETVMSHPSKIDELHVATANQFRTYLYFVSTQDVSINRQRVALRAAKGGHQVPDAKLTSRFDRSLECLATAANVAYRTYIFDNSNHAPELIAELTPTRQVVIHHELIPEWVNQFFVSRMESIQS